METDHGLLIIPPELLPVIGEPDEGTRLYRKEGDEDEKGFWFDALTEVFGSLVSPGGVALYAPVSRAAVHKRLKEGRMTAFCYHVKRTRKGFFG